MQLKSICRICKKKCKKICKICKQYAAFMILLNIACNMQNMQNNMHDIQNMQTSFPICRICTVHFADAVTVLTGSASLSLRGGRLRLSRDPSPGRAQAGGPGGQGRRRKPCPWRPRLSLWYAAACHWQCRRAGQGGRRG